MFPRHPVLLLAIGCFIFLLRPCAAQDGETVTLQFLSFPKAMDPQPVELLLGEGKTVEVATPTNALSQPYKVKRQGGWAVGKTEVNDKGESAFKVYGKAPGLSSSKQLILLVRKGPENADGMEVIPIDNDVKNFGGGKFLFINAAKIDIAGEAGGVKFVIPPSKRTIIQPKPDENGRNFHAMFYFRKDNEARPFFSSKWPIDKQARGLIFFYHDSTTQRLRIHSIQDFM
jgi:hypothetical protein